MGLSFSEVSFSRISGILLRFKESKLGVCDPELGGGGIAGPL